MEQTHLMLAVLLSGFVLLGIGFNWRDNEWGIRLMLVGIIAVLAPIGLHVYTTLN